MSNVNVDDLLNESNVEDEYASTGARKKPLKALDVDDLLKSDSDDEALLEAPAPTAGRGRGTTATTTTRTTTTVAAGRAATVSPRVPASVSPRTTTLTSRAVSSGRGVSPPPVASGRGRATAAAAPAEAEADVPEEEPVAPVVAGRGRGTVKASEPPRRATPTVVGRGTATADDAAAAVTTAAAPAVVVAGRGRATSSPRPSEARADDEESPAPAVASGRGRAVVEEAPVAASGRGRLATVAAPPPVRSQSTTVIGRGASEPPTRTQSSGTVTTSGRGKATAAAPADDDGAADESSVPSRSPRITTGRGAPVEGEEGPATVVATGRGVAVKSPRISVVGRGTATATTAVTATTPAATSSTTTSTTTTTTTAVAAGRAKALPTAPESLTPPRMASITPPRMAPVAVAGRGKAVVAAEDDASAPASSETLPTVGRGRGDPAVADAAPPTTARGRATVTPTARVVTPAGAAGRGVKPPPGADDDATVSRPRTSADVSRVRSLAKPIAPPKPGATDDAVEDAKTTPATAKAAPVKRRVVRGLESSDEEDEDMKKPMTRKQQAAVSEMLKEDDKDDEIISMEALIKDLQPSDEEVGKAMELASYMDREKAAEEEEAALVVQPKPVPKVSQTMSSESTVREAGLPTCLTIRKPWIVVGMTHGVCLVFDKDQKLSGIVGTQEGGDFGPVCSLAISNSSKMLLVGHESGAVVLWDIADARKPVKTVTDTHTSAVIHADFLKDDTNWVTGDVSGKMMVSTLTSMLFVYYHTAAPIPNDSRGCSLALRALRPGSTKDVTDALSPCAACTPLSTIVFSVFPKLKVHRMIPRNDSVRPGSIPYLSWREAVATGGSGPGEPILALGWGAEITLLRVRAASNNTDLLVEDMGHHTINGEITALTWLGYNAIVILTNLNEMQVFDPFSLQVLETSSLEGMHIAFHQRMTEAYGATEGCYSNSVVNQGDSGFVLGTSELYALRVLSWNERLSALIAENKFLLALATCLETFQLKGKGFLGISADPERVRKVAAEKIVVILTSFLANVLERKGSSVHERRVLASVCIRYCQGIGREALLFEVIFPKFRESGPTNEGIFLELLEPYILQDRLKSINVETMQAFVEHYEKHGWLRRVEQCILHLDVRSLDFDQVAKLCLAHNLSSALIYVYNSGLNDYITPLEHLFGVLADSKAKATGLRILLYLSKCLTGQAFLTGMIASDKLRDVKISVVKFLFSKEGDALRKLIQFDSRETFRVLDLVFDDALFAAPESAGGAPWHQQMLATLDKMLVDTKIEPFKAYRLQKSRLAWVTSAHLTSYFICLARVSSLAIVSINSEHVFQRMLGHLALDDDSRTRVQRQTALLQMVKSSAADRYDEKQLLELAQAGEMFEVAELFYQRQREYRKMVQCAIESSKYDKKHVFEVIGSLMTNGQLSEAEQATVRKTTMNSLEQLIEVDGEAASMLIIEHFAGEQYDKLVHELDAYPKLQFKLLRGIVSAQHNAGGTTAAARWENILQDFQMGPELTEIYVKLLCKFAPNEVYGFLIKAGADCRYEQCLAIVQPYKIEDATMFLLERTGDVSGAMESVLSALDAHIAAMKRSYTENAGLDTDAFPSTPTEKAVMDMLLVAVGLCQRNSKESRDAPENASLWFQLLDRMELPVTAKAGRLQSRRGGGAVRDSLPPAVLKAKQTMNFLMREVLRHMWSHVALPSILDKIVRDHAKSEFSEFKDVIFNMLETFQYERSILGLANHVLEYDMYEATNQLRKRRLRPYAPRGGKCRVCLQAFLDKPAGMLVYCCGHAFHRTCLSRVTFCPLCVTSKKGDKKAGGGGGASKKRAEGGEGGGEGESSGDERKRGKTMKQKAENAKDEDGAQAQVGAMVARYRTYIKATASTEVPKFELLKMLEQDVDLFRGARLNCAPRLRVDKKIVRRENVAMQSAPKFQQELTVDQAKFMFRRKRKDKRDDD